MRTKRNVVILLITATAAAVMGAFGFARLSELQKAETLKTEIPLRAVEAINENNPRYYKNPEAIASEEFTEREIRLETFNGKTYYEIKGSAPLRFEGGGFTEHYMIDIDVGTGECLRLANSSGKGYDRLSN